MTNYLSKVSASEQPYRGERNVDTVCTYIAYLRRATFITTATQALTLDLICLKVSCIHTVFDALIFIEVVGVRKENVEST